MSLLSRAALTALHRVVCLSAVTLVAAGCGSDSVTSNARPNIVFIAAEDITTLVGAYGDNTVPTPNIDQLAREGVRYTHAYQVAGVCAPARAGVITGMYPVSVGAHNMRTLSGNGAEGIAGESAFPPGMRTYSVVLPPDVRAFPEHLRAAGYYTTNNTKTDYQFIAPVTTWDENGPAASYRYRPPGTPFFAMYTLFTTHESMLTARNDPLAVDPAALKVPDIFPDTPAVRGDLARQYTNIAIMDRHLGELIRQLKADGVYDNSVIVFYADNGGTLPWYKREVLERGTHVPLIIRFPNGQNGGAVDDRLVSGVDFAPTALSLAGVPIPSYLQGHAFAGAAQAAARRYVYAARDRMDTEYDRVRMVRDARYQYLYNYEPGLPWYQNIQYRLQLPMMREILKLHAAGTLPEATARWFRTKPVEELYDLERDPWELNNLASDPGYRDKLVELRTAFHQWTQDVGDVGGISEPELVRRMWGGADQPPATATPAVVGVAGGVRIQCPTPGASIGYWVERSGVPFAPDRHTVQSWDAQVLFSDLGYAAQLGSAPLHNGAVQSAPPRWTIYDGSTIALGKGDTLHVNAQRIGYAAALVDYKDGATTRRASGRGAAANAAVPLLIDGSRSDS
ncbi:sulfatase [Burkholderia sp. HI2761]|uniref:sulfatase family protein n=1 Tax=unclassified Burkholderia TaxID=2613784 RepID=UPI000B79E064|nr:MULTISPECIES: sulfatase [unclassified Burkholderia]MPV59582.1 sulfatase-like hydrolase/transferase [Burkholderia sp. BE24]OXJ24259.1 sulfatase [Burkholderia sp. HI2761]